MKISKEQVAKNRERILDATARLIRERGLAGSGVDALTGAAGLTHGSLYSQFGSKDELIAQALSHASDRRMAARVLDADDAGEFISSYLSTRHRDNPGNGCFIATLGPDISRQSKPVRRTFTQMVVENVSWLSTLLPGNKRHREDEALTVMARMVGAMVLARSVDDPKLSERILSVNRCALLDKVE